MKIFKNKVGRPSNEMKMLKRTFYMSLIAIIASFIAIILSCVVNVKDSTTKTQGALLSDYQINLKSTNGKKANGSGWTNLWEYDTASSYTIEFEVINRKSDKVYYRYFAYDDDTNKLDYNSKTNGEFYYDKTICSTAVEKGYSKRKTVQKTINLSNKNKKIRSVLKLYTSKDDCKKDDNGKGKSVFSKEIVSKVKSSDNNSNNNDNDSDTKKAVSFLEWLINFFKSLFSKKDDKPSNSGNNEAATTKGIVLTCPSEAKINKEFTCTVNMEGVKISVTEDGLVTKENYKPSFVTISGDLTKQSKYNKTGTIIVKAEKSGYVTKTAKVEIVSGIVNSTYISGEYTKVIDNSGNYRNGKKQDSSSTTCNCYAKNFAEKIAKGSSSTSVTGCGTATYATDRCYSSETDTFNAIRNKIKDGYPVTVNVKTSGQHWIVVVGIKTSSISKTAANLTYSDFLIADPLRSGEDNWGSLINEKGNRYLRKQDGSQACSNKYRLGF